MISSAFYRSQQDDLLGSSAHPLGPTPASAAVANFR